MTDIDKEIETAADSIISEIISHRNGKNFDDITQVITFIVVVCTNAATLENLHFEKLSLDDQVQITADLFEDIYQHLKEANLIPDKLQKVIDEVTKDVDDLKSKLQVAITAYDLTTQITSLPAFKDVKKSGLKAVNKELKKIKIKF